MGFYGNITDVSRIQFQFDKIYNNRKAMDENASTDDIHIGRFVLVNYDSSGDNDEYTTNYNIDNAQYHNIRGYDSTVWQKRYFNGEEKYILVAELNTITPIFDIGEADAPRMIPLMPRFSNDSTNIYYKLHWSPSWGLRVKAANADLVGPILTTNGEATGISTKMSSNKNSFLSDEETKWHKTTYNQNTDTVSNQVFVKATENSGNWVTERVAQTAQGIPAAIYYNKAGFNPAKSFYAYKPIIFNSNTPYESAKYYYKKDGKYILAMERTASNAKQYYEKIEDKIQIEPTGYSGHKYNNYNSDNLSVQVDTQELSIMLPTIGDTIAAVWDLIYGGESVNGGVKRNLDISWEKARSNLDRQGLRLVTDFNINNNEYLYQTKNVETIAGAINSVHDLMGMIITDGTSTELNNNIALLDENRIYYTTDTHRFNRKRKKYELTPISENKYTYDPIDLTENQYAPGFYYIQNNPSSYIVANSPIKQNVQYYVRRFKTAEEAQTPEENAEYTEINLTPFDGSVYAYKDYIGADEAASANIKSDYIRDEIYHADKEYYRWDSIVLTTDGTNTSTFAQPISLSGSYEPGELYYKDAQGNYILSEEETPKTDRVYFEFKENNCIPFNSLHKDGIYVQGKYLYYDSATDAYRVDTYPQMDATRVYYELQYNQSAYDGVIYTREVSFIKTTAVDAQTYIPNAYWIRISATDYAGHENSPDYEQLGDYYYQLSTGNYVSGVDYYMKNIVLKRAQQEDLYSIDPNQLPVNLIQFHNDEFYHKEGNNFYVITSQADIISDTDNIYMLRKNTTREGTESNGGTYILNPIDFDRPDVSAMIRQQTFYEPGIYHYLAPDGAAEENQFTDLILDTYPQWTEGRKYYKIKSVGQPVNIDFYDSYQYYQYNETTNEYSLITDSEKPNTTIYEKNSYYVLNDEAGIYKKGAPWDFEIGYIPATLTLATREETYTLEPLVDFARNINTMHGMLLKTKAMLDYENEETRDPRTVQGALNLLADKTAQFSTWKAGQVVIADDYGRLHGVDIETDDNIIVDINSNPIMPKINISINTDIDDAADIQLTNYESSIIPQSNFRAINNTDTTGDAFNMLENKLNEITAETISEQSDPIPNVDEYATIRSQFWTAYNTWEANTLEYTGPESSDPAQGVFIPESISEDEADEAWTLHNDEVYVWDGHSSIYEQSEFVLGNENYFIPFEQLQSEFFDDFDNDHPLAGRSAADLYEDGENFDPGSTILPPTTHTTNSYNLAERIGTLERTVNTYAGQSVNTVTLDLTNEGVLSNHLATSAVVASKIANGAVTNDKILDNTITNSKLADNTITNTKIANNAVISTKLANQAVTSNKIANEAITNAHIADNSLFGAKLADQTITAAKIADATITGNKLTDGTIFEAKLDTNLQTKLNTTRYKDNLINTVEPFYRAQNVLLENNGVHLIYKRNDIDTYFYIQLSKPLKANRQYTLSFDCEGLAAETRISFNIYRMTGDYIVVSNGRNIGHFTPNCIPAYPRSEALEYSNEWLSTNPNGSALIPTDGQWFSLQQKGLHDDVDTIFSWSASRACYQPVTSVAIDDGENATRPLNTNIRLFNFSFVEGENAAEYNPSLNKINKDLERLNKLSSTDRKVIEGIKERDNNTIASTWSFNTVDDRFYTGVVEKYVDTQDQIIYQSGVKLSTTQYLRPLFPTQHLTVAGSCTDYGRYITNVNNVYNNTKENPNDDKELIPYKTVAVRFRIGSPVDDYVIISVTEKDFNKDKSKYYRKINGEYVMQTDQSIYNSDVYYYKKTSPYSVYTRLSLSGRIAVPVKNPQIAYNATIGQQIVDIAKTYTAVSNNGAGRKFYYGRNFFYRDAPHTINDDSGRGRMECDTFAGLVLRGIPYEQSPYADTTPGKEMSYTTMMANLQPSPYAWANYLRNEFDDEKYSKYINNEIRYASDYEWFFWLQQGALFTDISQARPGDVCFWRDPSRSIYWDAVTHVAIMGDDDDIYEVTGAQRSNNLCLHNIKLINLKDHLPCYFARPYNLTPVSGI